MTERYDELEQKVGILSYMSPENKGFAAVLKARYSDFIVHEVGTDLKVARLESLADNLREKEKEEVEKNKPEVKKEEGEGSSNGDVTVTGTKRGTSTDNGDDDKLQPATKKPKTENNDETADNDVKMIEDSTPTTTHKDNHPKSTPSPSPPSKPSLSQAQEELIKLLDAEKAEGITTLLQKWEDYKADHRPVRPVATLSSSSNSDMVTTYTAAMTTDQSEIKNNTKEPLPRKGVDDDKKYYLLPPIADKDVRKQIHMLLRGPLLQPYAVADTSDAKEIRIWHKLFERHSSSYKKFGNRNRNDDGGRGGRGGGRGDRGGRCGRGGRGGRNGGFSWPEDRPPYLQFVLYKENIDTSTAAKDIARVARLPPKQHHAARGGHSGMGYAGMKDKRGVTTQFCTVYHKEPKDMLPVNRRGGTSGGGNTRNGGYGLMRVGGFEYVDRQIGLGGLSGNRFDIVLRNVCVDGLVSNEDKIRIAHTQKQLQSTADSMKKYGFINYFGMQRFGKFLDTHKVGLAVLKHDFQGACDIIMSVKADESERQKEARTIWAQRFSDVDMNDEEATRKAEVKCAREIRGKLGRFMNCEISIVDGLSRRPRDYRRAFGVISKQMRSMFLHAYQSLLWNRAASHRIKEEGGGRIEAIVGDLVLTTDDQAADGGKGGGSSGLKGKEVEVVTQEDVDAFKYSITDVVLPMIGSKIQYPTNSTGKLFETMLAEDGLSLKDFEKSSMGDSELALGGDYRKIICKPNDVQFEIKKYTDPLQPLIQTDLMKVENIPLKCIDLMSIDAAVGDNVNADAKNENTAGKKDNNNHKSKAILGMVIGFTLPPSAYATVALRELMKRPTSSKYQSGLKLEGDCEANFRTTKMEYTAETTITTGQALDLENVKEEEKEIDAE